MSRARSGATPSPRCSSASACPPEVAKSRAGQLSGGQRQRVSLARATVVPPSVLLCDEPTSALDVSLAASVLNLIGDLRRSLDMSVVFVTHDLSVARVVADRIAVMYLGRIVEIGPAEQVIGDPAHPYTQALVDSIPDLGRESRVLPGEPASPLSPPTGCAFHPRCPIAVDTCGGDPNSTCGWRASPATRTKWPASNGGRADGRRDTCTLRWSAGRERRRVGVAGDRGSASCSTGSAFSLVIVVTADRGRGAAARAARSAAAGRHAAAGARARTASCSAPTASAATSCRRVLYGVRSSWFAALVVVAVGLLDRRPGRAHRRARRAAGWTRC